MIKVYMFLIIMGILGAVGYGGYMYYKDTQQRIMTLKENNAKLELFLINAITKGTDAQAEVTVRLEEKGKTVNGQGTDTDTMVASVKAYAHALNKLLVKREKTAPAALSA